MEVHLNVRLPEGEILQLLQQFDDSSDVPLHEGLDFMSYSKKLSRYAYFLFAVENATCIGFIAYYLNTEGKFIYIPQIIVHKSARHAGVGNRMMSALRNAYSGEYGKVLLEVLKENTNARDFYKREGFVEEEDRGKRLLLSNKL